ncbi:MAG: glycoside hydrolase family 10 protein [Verrucomicrobiales bacterium]
MRRALLLILGALPGLRADNVLEPPREFRAAWIASVHNLDWPSRPGLSAPAQKSELLVLLDLAASLHLNAVILQVRPSGDACYASSIEPWSPFLSGKMGSSPGYDPLAFAVEEAHRRGLELHAWFNPFRAQASPKYPPAGRHLGARHPEWMRGFAGSKWFDPGEPGVRDHALAVIRDVVRRYDIDGVHIDDYFYPYPPSGTLGLGVSGFPDGATFSRHGRGQGLAEWRRSNVNAFVSALYSSVKSLRPSVKVGISPFGIWRPDAPEGIQARLDSFEYLAADSRTWLRRGWCDYLSPQLYWRIDPPQQSFPKLLHWWHSENSNRRHVWPGICTARVQSSEDRGRPANEIVRQIDLARQLSRQPSGHVHWSIKALRQNRGGIAATLKNGPYAERALVPASPWLGSNPPQRPWRHGRVGLSSFSRWRAFGGGCCRSAVVAAGRSSRCFQLQ